MQDSDFRYSLNQNPFPEYYNLKTEPVPQEDHDLDHGSLLIHEDEVSQAEVATYSIKGLDELDIPPEKQEIIKNANFFKHLSLSFYPKDKIRTEGSLE